MAVTIYNSNTATVGPRCGIGKQALYQATVYGSGAVSADWFIEATNDGIGWFTIWDASVAGTDVATAFWNDPGSWDSVRVGVTALSEGASFLVTVVPTP